MSKAELKDSDDEFQDALTDVTAASETRTAVKAENGGNAPTMDASGGDAPQAGVKTHEDIVEEITRQQADLKLPDDDEEDETKAEGGVDLKQEEEEVLDDIDEEGLRERDKGLTQEELDKNKAEADRMKLEANELFQKNEAEKAIEIYTEALHICPTTHPKERAILYGNRAAAKIKLDCKKAALQDCSKAIELWPEYVRALLRRAKLYEHDDKLDEALEDYKKVYELDPGQRDARDAMVRLPPIINERNEKMKTEMLGKLKDLGNMILKPFGLSTENFQMQQDPNTGSYSINFNQGPR